MNQITRLGDVADVIRGVSFDKSEMRSNPADDCLPVLRAGNIQDRLLIDTDLIWVPSVRISPEQMLRAGDIAIAVSSGSSSLVGKTAVLEQEWLGSVGAFCAIVRPRKNINSQYLARWFRSPQFSLWRESKTRGANIQNLQIGDIYEINIDLPSLEKQDEIAKKISRQLDVARELHSSSVEQCSLAQRMTVATLGECFSENTPISTGLFLRGNQIGWKWSLLSEFARLESGHTPSRRHPEWWGGDVPWLALPDIRKLHGKHAYDTTEYTNGAGLANSSARMLPAGTVCLSRTASVGYATILGKPMATSQDFVNWICDEDRLDPEFLMYAFMASREYLQQLGSGAVHKSIYMPTVKSFHICAPDIAEQRRIARTLRERLAAAEQLTAGLQTRLAEIECLPQRLLAAAFAGNH